MTLGLMKGATADGERSLDAAAAAATAAFVTMGVVGLGDWTSAALSLEHELMGSGGPVGDALRLRVREDCRTDREPAAPAAAVEEREQFCLMPCGPAFARCAQT